MMGCIFLMTIFICFIGIQPVFADSAAEIDRQVDAALQMLHHKIPKAKELSKVWRVRSQPLLRRSQRLPRINNNSQYSTPQEH
jgi:hypothetical protein